MSHPLDEIGAALFTSAAAEQRCGELLQCLWTGGSAAIDPDGKLVIESAEQLAGLANAATPPAPLGTWVDYHEFDGHDEPVPTDSLADGCTVRVLFADSLLGRLGVLELTFGNSHTKQQLRVNYVADAGAVRHFGRLVRDSSNAVANRLEGKAR